MWKGFMDRIKNWWETFPYKKYAIPIFLLGIIIIVFLFLMPKKSTNEIVDEIEDPISETVEEKTTIKVDIKGAVLKPGLYELEKGSRIQDVIAKSGGLNVDADTSMINLSKVLEDEMVVIIYTKGEIAAFEEGKTAIKYIEKECICPSLENDGCIDSSKTETNKSSNSTTVTGKVSLNKASLQELMTLPGVGEVKAKAILAYREEHGSFKTIEELKNIKGIGNSTFEKLKDYITI